MSEVHIVYMCRFSVFKPLPLMYDTSVDSFMRIQHTCTCSLLFHFQNDLSMSLYNTHMPTSQVTVIIPPVHTGPTEIPS